MFAGSSRPYRATRGTAGSETVTVDVPLSTSQHLLCDLCALCVEKSVNSSDLRGSGLLQRVPCRDLRAAAAQ